MRNYKPLPDNLRLGFSDVHDIGLFAKELIPQGTNLGMTHFKIGELLIRTPMGGFINHALPRVVNYMRGGVKAARSARWDGGPSGLRTGLHTRCLQAGPAPPVNLVNL